MTSPSFPVRFDRPVKIDVCRDGTLSYRIKGQKPLHGRALPVCSVDTEDEARELQLVFGVRQHAQHTKQPGRDWFVWPGMYDLDDEKALTLMHEVIEPMLAAHYHLHIRREPPPEGSRWLHKDCARVVVVRSANTTSVVYFYEQTVGTAPGRIRRRGGGKRAANPVQMLAFDEWRRLFTRPALSTTLSRRGGPQTIAEVSARIPSKRAGR